MKPIHLRECDILVIGEIFVEFRCIDDIVHSERYEKGVGGADVYTAITAARFDAITAFVSAIAHDPFHNFLRDALLSYGINIDHVVTCKGYNGIYFTSSTENDVREYLYHRPGNAAENISPAMIYDDLIENTKIVFASSELQSVSKSTRHAVFKAMHHAHRNDIMVAYDPNLRLHRWSLDDAKEGLWSVLPLIDVIFPSSPDESKALFGYERPLDVIGFLWDRGISIVAVKNGPSGCMVGYDGKVEEFPIAVRETKPCDLTLVGSVFDGAFLACIAKGDNAFVAAEIATKAASTKAMGHGPNAIPMRKDLVS